MNQRQRNALKTKMKISQVAMELFHEKGFGNVTVDEIIEKTSTSKGAFYNHFKSKHDIFAEKFKEIDHFYVDEILPLMDYDAPVVDKLKKFLRMQMTYIESNLGWDVVRTIYEQELNTERTSFFMNPDRPLYGILYNLCDDGIKNSEFRQDLSTDELVTVLVRVMRGILYDWSMNKGNYSLASEQEVLFAVVIQGMKGNGRGERNERSCNY